MKKSHFKENKMNFIYYVLILMLTYVGPAYAEFDIVEEDVGDYEQQKPTEDLYAQNDVVVGELPSGKIKIYTDKTHTTTLEVDKQDCSIMRKKDDSVAFGWKFGGLIWGFGPEIKIGHSSGVAWKADVQHMVAEYQELCTQFNTGRLSQQEYQQEKEGIIKRGYNYARELEKRFKQKKDDMFKEMDKGKFIHLQNAHFYEGCCYYPNEVDDKNLVAEVQPQVQSKRAFSWSDRVREYFAKLDKREYMERHNRFQKQFRQDRDDAFLEYRDRMDKLSYQRTQARRNYIFNSNRSFRRGGWNWDVYGNSNNEWNARVERSW